MSYHYKNKFLNLSTAESSSKYIQTNSLCLNLNQKQTKQSNQSSVNSTGLILILEKDNYKYYQIPMYATETKSDQDSADFIWIASPVTARQHISVFNSVKDRVHYNLDQYPDDLPIIVSLITFVEHPELKLDYINVTIRIRNNSDCSGFKDSEIVSIENNNKIIDPHLYCELYVATKADIMRQKKKMLEFKPDYINYNCNDMQFLNLIQKITDWSKMC